MTKFEEDIIYIKNILKDCYRIEFDNKVYYIFDKNVVRLLKYNKLSKTKKDIFINLKHLKFENIILEQNIDIKTNYISIDIWNKILDKIEKYRFINLKHFSEYISQLCDNILGTNNYVTYYTSWSQFNIFKKLTNNQIVLK